jgi:hypothetical protein
MALLHGSRKKKLCTLLSMCYSDIKQVSKIENHGLIFNSRLLSLLSKFLGPWGLRNRVEEHGALLALGFYKTRMKLFLNSWDEEPNFDLFSDTTKRK